MADFHTSSTEEMLIDRVRKDGFGYSENLGFSDSDFPKYLVLRLAIAKALRCSKISLNNELEWNAKKLSEEKGSKGGKEYHLEQITGKGKGKNEDFDIALRGLFYAQHKAELDEKKADIFKDDKEYLGILSRYIQRGLYELQHSWKGSDCIYQWCLDNLGFEPINTDNTDTKRGEIYQNYFERLREYFKNFAINIKLMNEENSYRHHICKIELVDADKIQAFKMKAKNLKDELGCNVFVAHCEGLSRAYDIQIAKPKEEWQSLGLREFSEGLALLKKRGDKLGIFAGNSIDKTPFCFDLASTPHLFVAGTSGSGKTAFLQTMIVCLLQSAHTQIMVIDPKQGVGFRVFGERIKLIVDMDEVGEALEELIAEMNERNAAMSEQGYNNIEALGFDFKVLIIDELNNLIENNKALKDKLARLAEMARQAGIHLVLGTQRPDGVLLKGLRNNIDGKIALRVQKASESEIILDEKGAESLLGSGDMFIRLGDMPEKKRILSCYLQQDEIKGFL